MTHRSRHARPMARLEPGLVETAARFGIALPTGDHATAEEKRKRAELQAELRQVIDTPLIPKVKP